MTEASPTPEAIFDALVAYQRSAALKGAIDLDLFTALAEGASTAPALAERCGASQRGVRSLADYLVVAGFLTKEDGAYGLTPESAVFLDRNSERCIAPVASFLGSSALRGAFDDVAATVRRGGTLLGEAGTLAPDHEVWIEFARGMAPMARPQAVSLAELLGPLRGRALDVAAGHGLYGIELAKRNERLEVVALDWANVLEVARENAGAEGVAGSFSTLAGDALTVDLGGPYELVLLTNFLHHFDVPTCEGFLRRVRAVLAPGGQVVTLESPPNEDRVSPPHAASFSLIMLATTPGGEAYTAAELRAMFTAASFSSFELEPLPDSLQSVLVASP